MNPCPCGYYGDPTHECKCTPQEIRRYAGRLSGPLMDRIDMRIEVAALDYEELEKREAGEDSAAIRRRVNAAREIQNRRFAGDPGIYANAQLTPSLIEKYCVLNPSEQALMKKIYRRMSLSVRGYHRILKLARTIADLAGVEQIDGAHLMEAVRYRSTDEG